ncbi:hypothetical protein FH966_11810 [Lentibacillus cibarius]|uniref:Uncharacterized protein n=1 Tax=Lentibacillus cibarius TaxID=2583219 RepID=A0A549YKB1_9BACI|nr:hypothetical protein [Lentibacillus cibarius]TRM12316.1 hypothetical protein FH966_11810 [Lentibacillus cibarius]
MMKKRTALITIGIMVLLLSLFFIYRFYFAKPSAFPPDEQLAEQMNNVFPKANVETIQDTIKLDTEHVFVPFQSSDNHYGASYWIWERNEWKPAKIDTLGKPMIWNIDSENPSASHIVWNLHPSDGISKADFYLIRKRSYFISRGEHTYIPRIQMKESVNFGEESYGVLALPDDWRSFMTETTEMASEQKLNTAFTNILTDKNIFIGWMPLNDHHKVTYPEHSVNGNSFNHSYIDIGFVGMVDKDELEK